MHYGSYEANLLEHALLPDLINFDHRKVLFVDVGANIGLWTLFAASKGYHTVSVEANPRTFRMLSANVELNGLAERVELHLNGVGEEPGRLFIGNFGHNMGANNLRNMSSAYATPIDVKTNEKKKNPPKLLIFFFSIGDYSRLCGSLAQSLQTKTTCGDEDRHRGL